MLTFFLFLLSDSINNFIQIQCLNSHSQRILKINWSQHRTIFQPRNKFSISSLSRNVSTNMTQKPYNFRKIMWKSLRIPPFLFKYLRKKSKKEKIIAKLSLNNMLTSSFRIEWKLSLKEYLRKEKQFSRIKKNCYDYQTSTPSLILKKCWDLKPLWIQAIQERGIVPINFWKSRRGLLQFLINVLRPFLTQNCCEKDKRMRLKSTAL